jgi:hypothetical protein
MSIEGVEFAIAGGGVKKWRMKRTGKWNRVLFPNFVTIKRYFPKIQCSCKKQTQLCILQTLANNLSSVFLTLEMEWSSIPCGTAICFLKNKCDDQGEDMWEAWERYRNTGHMKGVVDFHVTYFISFNTFFSPFCILNHVIVKTPQKFWPKLFTTLDMF